MFKYAESCFLNVLLQVVPLALSFIVFRLSYVCHMFVICISTSNDPTLGQHKEIYHVSRFTSFVTDLLVYLAFTPDRRQKLQCLIVILKMHISNFLPIYQAKISRHVV